LQVFSGTTADRSNAAMWKAGPQPDAETVVVGEFATYGETLRVAHEVKAAHKGDSVHILRDGYDMGYWQ